MYEVATLCDIDAVRGAAVARRFAIPATVDRLERLLERDLDIVDICTPSGLHQAQAIAALEAGFHVVVEKPVARSLAEVDAIAAAEAASGRRVCPIFQYRFGHGVQKLAHLMRQGLRRPPVGRHRRDPLVPRRRLLRRRQLARHLRRRARRLPDHPRHPHPRHSLRGPRPDRLGARPHLEPAEPQRDRGHGGPLARLRERRLRHLLGHPRLAPGDVAAALLLRRARRRERPLRPTTPATSPGPSRTTTRTPSAASPRRSRTSMPLPERFVGQFHRLHAALTGGGALPVTLDRCPPLDRAPDRRLLLRPDRRGGCPADPAATIHSTAAGLKP